MIALLNNGQISVIYILHISVYEGIELFLCDYLYKLSAEHFNYLLDVLNNSFTNDDKVGRG